MTILGIFIQELLKERGGGSKVSILAHPVFWAVLTAKGAALLFLGSNVLTENYIPLVNYFVDSGFSNPYAWALDQGISFPFPALMLFLLTIPKLTFSTLVGWDMLIMRLPILIADVGIFLVLTRWLKDKQAKVLWYYWCSPILFAISYVAGFLDLLPIAFLFAFLFFLFKEQFVIAFALLGFALATKSGLVILLPFILIYLLKEYVRPIKILEYALLSCAVYIASNAGFLASPEFWQVAIAGGQSYFSGININFGGAVVYIAPLVCLGLFVSCFAFQRLHRDMFLMFLAFALGVITLVVLPQAGWYSWTIPFFIYFFVKEDRAEKYPFVLLNLAYFAYFLITPNSAFLTALHIPATILGEVPANIAFTFLQGTLLLNIIWIYRIGIQNGMRHKILYKPYLIGIAGDSASGKTTLTDLISKILGGHNILEVAGDDMHKWERGDPHWSHITHLNPHANRLHDDMEHALRLKRNEGVVRRFYDHTIGRFTLPEHIRPKKIVVFQGLHTLYLNRARALFDLKIFLSPNEELRREWKVDRDGTERGHAVEHVLKQLDERSADSEKYIREQSKHADIVISISRAGVRNVLEVACDNSINVDPLISALKNKAPLEISHEHGDTRQHIVFTGDIPRETIDELAYALVPDVWEINRRDLQWEDGHNGILQVFLAYVVFYKARLDHDSF